MSLKTNDDAYCALMSLALAFGSEDFTLNGARELLAEAIKQGFFHRTVHMLSNQEKTKYIADSFGLSNDLNEISSAFIVSMFIGMEKPISSMLTWNKSKHQFKFSNAYLTHIYTAHYRGRRYEEMQLRSEGMIDITHCPTNTRGIIYYAT